MLKAKMLGVALTLVVGLSLAAQEPVGPAGNDRPAEQQQPAPAKPQDTPRKSGRFEMVKQRVWVPGGREQVWVPPVFRTGLDEQGREVQLLVEPGYYRTITIPGRYEIVTRKVWVALGKPVPATSFSLTNSRKFQVQLQSMHVTLSDGSNAMITLPRDRVISSTAHLGFDLPPDAVSVTVRFKTWDWGNKRFQFPIYAAHYPLEYGPAGTIH